MTKAEKTEYATLTRMIMRKQFMTAEQTTRMKELRLKDIKRALSEGHGYIPSESYMTSNMYDR